MPPGAVVADIGTDHALLPVYLVRQGIVRKVIATDVHSRPLDAARSTVARYGLCERIVLREGDGLRVLSPGEADVIVIAGMGGTTIRDILADSLKVQDQVKRLILQPQGGALCLRKRLLDHEWFLFDEDLVFEDGRYYVIIVAEPRPQSVQRAVIDPGILEIGPRLIEKKHRLLVPYLKQEIRQMEKIVRALKEGRTPAADEKRRAWNQKIDFYREVIRCQSSVKPS